MLGLLSSYIISLIHKFCFW